MRRREGGGEAMVRVEEAAVRQMERWERRRADADEDGRDEEAPAVIATMMQPCIGAIIGRFESHKQPRSRQMYSSARGMPL